MFSLKYKDTSKNPRLSSFAKFSCLRHFNFFWRSLAIYLRQKGAESLGAIFQKMNSSSAVKLKGKLSVLLNASENSKMNFHKECPHIQGRQCNVYIDFFFIPYMPCLVLPRSYYSNLLCLFAINFVSAIRLLVLFESRISAFVHLSVKRADITTINVSTLRYRVIFKRLKRVQEIGMLLFTAKFVQNTRSLISHRLLGAL